MTSQPASSLLPPPDQKAGYVRNMFNRIAGRYDLLNRLMALGRDISWRKELIGMLSPQAGQHVLDVGSGSGDLALLLWQRCPEVRLVACDFSIEMIKRARQRPGAEHVRWVIADGMNLPFAGEAFDQVVSGFFMRNAPDAAGAVQEQYRVVGRQGKVGVLDTTPLNPGPFRPLLSFYLDKVIPWVGALVGGDREAYRYLAVSTRSFVRAEKLAHLMETAGFRQVRFIRRMFGSVALHVGEK
ncbi:MAG: ubiquinone/menaquinone biosynthesis methyltransferase [Chloroflexi bacterium]|nr:ubiquinone/menaquinone biosynthesis methyltransferase [Chloroflexota bacterium]